MKDNIVSVRLENRDYDLLQQLAQLRGESVSDIIREALHANLHSSNIVRTTVNSAPSHLTLVAS